MAGHDASYVSYNQACHYKFKGGAVGIRRMTDMTPQPHNKPISRYLSIKMEASGLLSIHTSRLIGEWGP
jgi:hypothetical protein